MGVAFDGQNSVPVEFRQLHGVKHSFLVFPDQFQNIGIQGQVLFCCKVLDDLFHPLWNRQIHSVINNPKKEDMEAEYFREILDVWV